jgi:hypothetical protein
MQQQAQIELLNIEDDGSGNETASAEINGAAICNFLRREDELMTELMNHKRSTSYQK